MTKKKKKTKWYTGLYKTYKEWLLIAAVGIGTTLLCLLSGGCASVTVPSDTVSGLLDRIEAHMSTDALEEVKAERAALWALTKTGPDIEHEVLKAHTDEAEKVCEVHDVDVGRQELELGPEKVTLYKRTSEIFLRLFKE
jgi:hypothetical protein